MQILTAYPPNYQEIKQHLKLDGTEIFAYGNIIYNPSGTEIPEDIQIHEAVHQKQQENFTSPESWWTRYIYEKDFRKTQEAEAFRLQYQFIKDHYPKKAHKEALYDLTMNLKSDRYALNLSFHEAEKMIK